MQILIQLVWGGACDSILRFWITPYECGSCWFIDHTLGSKMLKCKDYFSPLQVLKQALTFIFCLLVQLFIF